MHASWNKIKALPSHNLGFKFDFRNVGRGDVLDA